MRVYMWVRVEMGLASRMAVNECLNNMYYK